MLHSTLSKIAKSILDTTSNKRYHMYILQFFSTCIPYKPWEGKLEAFIMCQKLNRTRHDRDKDKACGMNQSSPISLRNNPVKQPTTYNFPVPNCPLQLHLTPNSASETVRNPAAFHLPKSVHLTPESTPKLGHKTSPKQVQNQPRNCTKNNPF